MQIDISFTGKDFKDKYKVVVVADVCCIKKITDTTDYSGSLSDKVVNTEKVTEIVIKYHDLHSLVLALQKAIY